MSRITLFISHQEKRMFSSILVDEFKYNFWSLHTLVIAGLFFSIAFLLTANSVEFTMIAQGGMVYINSPYAITVIMVFLSLFASFIVPAYMSTSVLKDVDHKFDSILFSTPITKPAYLLGRFLGSFTALICVLFIVPVAMYLGTFWPWASAENLAVNNINHYIFIFICYLLPSIFTLSALIFAVAILTRSMLYSYLAALGVLILYITVLNTSLISNLWDPFMAELVFDQTKYWSAAELNSQILGFSGEILANRLIWFLFSICVLAMAYWFYSFANSDKKPVNSKHKTSPIVEFKKTNKNIINFTPRWSQTSHLKQLLFRTGFEIKSVIYSKPFIVLMAYSFFMLFFALIGRQTTYDVNRYPLTLLLIQSITTTLTLAMMAVLAFYSADVIWRERTHKFNEIIDALPVPNWVFVTSKVTAIVILIFSMVILGIIIAISLQVFSGFYDFKLERYLGMALVYYPIPYIFLAVLACFFQVLAKNRVLGLFLFILFLILVALSHDIFGVKHILLSYALPGVANPLSDMNYNSRFFQTGIWLRIYWGAIAGVLIMLTYLFWNRGTLQPLKYRLRNLRQLQSKGFAVPIFLFFVLFLGSGSYIFYNTNVLNDYYTESDMDQVQLAYEKKYRQYQFLPMPDTVDVKIEVDLYPYKRRVEINSTQILQNNSDQPIHSIHLTFPFNIEVLNVEIQGVKNTIHDKALSYYIFELNQPLLPGERTEMTFENLIQQQGFTNSDPDTTLVRNGTFLRSTSIAPYIGFCECIMIQEPSKRIDYGLEPLDGLAKLENTANYNKAYIRSDSDYINYQAVVSTVSNQMAITTGHLIDQWENEGRNYFSYKAEQPILNAYSFVSAEYETVYDEWNDVDIGVFYDKEHGYNVDVMIQSIKNSLDYYSSAFGAYQYNHLRIIEFPSYRKVAQAFAGTIPFSEGIGFIADVRDKDEFNLPYYVTAHEMAHQWWAHQVMSAHTQGGVMLLETLAQYSAIMVLEKNLGIKQTRMFLQLELDKYLNGRAKDIESEQPLFKVGDQPYIYYRKGALAMYALKEYIGEDIINKALRQLVKNHAYQSAPYATSLDFIGYLKQQAGQEHYAIIEDTLEKITLYDFKIKNSTVTPMIDGRYKVLVDIEANKNYQDDLGNLTQTEIQLPIEIGLFLTDPKKPSFKPNDTIYLQKHAIQSGESSLEIIVDKKPLIVGIDPFNLLIDRDTNDNINSVHELKINLTNSEKENEK